MYGPLGLIPWQKDNDLFVFFLTMNDYIRDGYLSKLLLCLKSLRKLYSLFEPYTFCGVQI